MTETATSYDEYLDALRGSDERAAWAAVDRATAGGMAPEQIYVEVFQPALISVGKLWQTNQFCVAEEHLATTITRRLMAQFSSYFRAPRVGSGRRLLIGCVEGELHEVGLQMVDDVFFHRGWDVVYLGANVPTSDFFTMVDAVQPTVIGLSSTMVYHVRVIQQLVQELRARERAVTVAVGGYPFNSINGLWQKVGADMYAGDAVAAVSAADELLAGTRPDLPGAIADRGAGRRIDPQYAGGA